MNHNLHFIIIWGVTALIALIFFARPAHFELMHLNGVRRWKRLLFGLSIALVVFSTLATLFYLGIYLDIEIIPQILNRYAIATVALIGVICASLMYRH